MQQSRQAKTNWGRVPRKASSKKGTTKDRRNNGSNVIDKNKQTKDPKEPNNNRGIQIAKSWYPNH